MNTDIINPEDELIQEMKIEDLKKIVRGLQFETVSRTSEIIEGPEETDLSDESDLYVKEQN
jgi:hypothetical protein